MEGQKLKNEISGSDEGLIMRCLMRGKRLLTPLFIKGQFPVLPGRIRHEQECNNTDTVWACRDLLLLKAPYGCGVSDQDGETNDDMLNRSAFYGTILEH